MAWQRDSCSISAFDLINSMSHETLGAGFGDGLGSYGETQFELDREAIPRPFLCGETVEKWVDSGVVFSHPPDLGCLAVLHVEDLHILPLRARTVRCRSGSLP